MIEFLDDDMNVVDTVSPATVGSLFAVYGDWYAIKSIHISNGSGNPNTSNLAEVHTLVLNTNRLVSLGFVALRRNS